MQSAFSSPNARPSAAQPVGAGNDGAPSRLARTHFLLSRNSQSQKWFVSVLLGFLSLWFLAAPLPAANVRLYFQSNTNAAVLDTNVIIATPISPNVLANGGVIAQGLPFRITPTSSGVVTQSFNLGWFAISNRVLGRGVVINVYDSSSTLYDLTNVIQSGFNTYRVTVFGTNPPPTFDETTNALGFLPLTPTQVTNALGAFTTAAQSTNIAAYQALLATNALNVSLGAQILSSSNVLAARLITTSNFLQSQITAATNSGITAVTATNISAYQASLATNNTPTLATNAARTLVNTYSNTLFSAPNFGQPISVTNAAIPDKNIFWDEDLAGYTFANIHSLGLVRSLGVFVGDGRGLFNLGITNSVGNATNAINATNIYGAGLVTMTNVAITRGAVVSNGVVTAYTAADTVVSNGLSTRLLNTNASLVSQFSAADAVVSNGISVRLLNTNTSLISQFGAADTVVSNGLVALIGSGTAATNAIAIENGYGTNTRLYFITANWGTNNANSSASSVVLSGSGHSIGAANVGSTLSGGGSNSVAASSSWSTIGGGLQNIINKVGYGNTISGGATNWMGNGFSGSGNVIGGGVFNIMYSGSHSVIPGGYSNTVGSSYSLAAGLRAVTEFDNTFVWSDGTDNSVAGNYFQAALTNTFIIRATNGVSINTNHPGGNALKVIGTTATDNLAFGRRTVVAYTTNVIAVIGAGSSAANGTFQWGGGRYTNSFTSAVITNNTGSNWQIRDSVGTVLYSATGAPAETTYTVQSGSSPAPSTYYGVTEQHNGTVLQGIVTSTNLEARFTVSAAAVATNDARLLNFSASPAVVATNFVGNGGNITNLIIGMPIYHVYRYGAFPDDGVSDTAQIQAAYDAAAAAGGGVVVLEAGTYTMNPDLMTYPTRVTENHPNMICAWSNNVSVVGMGMNQTILKQSKEYTNGVINFFGAGAGGSDPFSIGTTNVVIAGLTFDADGYASEVMQVFSPSNWIVMDVRAKGAGWRSANNYDGFDFQVEGLVVFKDIEASDCWGNGFGATSVDGRVFADGVTIIRCGMAGGTGGAIQCTANPPPVIRNLRMIDCGNVMARDSFLNVANGYFWITNTASTVTNFDIGTSVSVFLSDCEFRTPTTGGGQTFWVRGGGLYLNNVTINNYQSGILMASGEVYIRNSAIGANGSARPLVTTGGAVVIENSTISGNSAQRDIRISSGTASANIRNNRFQGTAGVLIEAPTGFLFDNNYCAGPLYVSAAGTLIRNIFASGTCINGSASSVYVDNIFTAGYQRDGGTPVFLGNVWNSMSDSTRNELQESLPAAVSITPTATQTLWTNNTAYTVEVFYYGGTIDAVGKNGSQISSTASLGGRAVLNPADWVGITNSVTVGQSIKYWPIR